MKYELVIKLRESEDIWRAKGIFKGRKASLHFEIQLKIVADDFYEFVQRLCKYRYSLELISYSDLASPKDVQSWCSVLDCG